MKKILITGSSGLIGTNLAIALHKAGELGITCLDINPAPVQLNEICYVLCDVIDYVFPHKYDVIYNLACNASPVLYQKDQVHTFNTCVHGLQNLIAQSDPHTVIVHASTSEVYGCAQVVPQSEEYFGYVHTTGPRSCYDEGKRAAETLAYLYKGSRDIRIARIFNTYGPWSRNNDGRVIPNFIEAALTNKPIHIYGDGSRTRSFMYVGDLVRALMALAQADTSLFGPYNVGNPHEVTILELVKTIIEMTCSTSHIVYDKDLEDEPMRRCPDVSKIKKDLQWEPKIPLHDGLRTTIDWYRKKL